MSHQSGIHSSDELKQAFASAIQADQIRTIKATIDGEDLNLVSTHDCAGTYDADWDTQILPLLADDHGCYIFVRTDEKSANGSEWILLCYCPDNAPVREKMLYASTRATMKREFGSNLIVDEIFGSLKDEVSFAGFQKHKVAAAADAPLTLKEEEQKELAQHEVGADIGASSRFSTVAGIQFPVEEQAIKALRALHDGSINHVQLKVDVQQEVIQLAEENTKEPSDLAATYPAANPRYTIYAYDHKFEGLVQKAIVFIYMCPGYQCPIKERMLYSSCKADVLLVVEKEVGLPIDAKVESSDPVDINDEFLMSTVHPVDVSMIEKPKFNRPKKAGRGARKVVGK